MFSKQKLFFEVSDEPSELTLEEAFCGACGTVRLGRNGIDLWVPGDEIDLENEMIFDIRSRPISEQDAVLFKNACKGRFMNVTIALMVGTDPERIKYVLDHFDYVLIPDKKIKNTPKDFGARILSYTAK